MASMPDVPKWGLDDLRGPKDVAVYDVWDQVNLRVEGDPARGITWPGSVVMQKYGSRRPMYTNSPIYVIPGTTTKGREPTNYSRVVFYTTTHENVYIRALPGWGNTIDTPIESATLGTIFTNYLGNPRGSFWIGHNFPDWAEVNLQNAESRAITECLVKLGDMKADVGVALAELTKTTTHLAKTATDLWGSVKALRNRQWKVLINILSKRSPLHSRKITVGKTAAQVWLEYNYAWKPLFMEAQGLVELVKLKLEPALLVHANRTIHTPLSLSLTGSYSDHWSSVLYTLRGTGKHEACCRLTGKIKSETLRYAVASGLANPATILWELMPYSFVIDWSLPIGNYLQAATSTRGLDFVWGSVSHRMQTHTFVDMRSQPGRSTLRPGYGELMKYGLNRRKLYSFPGPELYAKSPFSSSHIGSALALLRSLT